MTVKQILLLPLAALVLAGGIALHAKENNQSRRLSLTALEDKIRGGWAGQMIGVSYGAPTEFRYLGKIIEGDLPWSPDRVTNSINQDDLYVEMTFANVMDKVGLNATTEQYGAAFKDTKYDLWHANAAARRLLNSGVKAPLSGDPRYNIHANDIDFQIESDFIGLMTPGLPQESNKYCDRVGRVMNYGDGLYGGMFVCGMYSAAFFESDPRKVVEQGLACLPAESGYAKIIRDVLDGATKNPDDWRATWQLLEDKWDKGDSCTGGALQPFNIDARLNGAYIAMGLLYGKGDWARTLEISTRCGQDSDCNPSSAAGILGVMLGYEKIPEQWKSGIAKIGNEKFAHTDYSFQDIIRSTQERAFTIIRQVGGSVTDTEVVIPPQAPKAPKLEQWTMGEADKIIPASDPAWTWKGDWAERRGHIEYRTPVMGKTTATSSAEATFTFTGTGVVLVSPHSQKGGRADVYLDGKKQKEFIEFYIVPETNDDSLWHTYGLKPGMHTVRLVIREDADSRSTGKDCAIMGAITYR